MSLPYLPYASGHAKGGQITFGGLNHNLYAADGEIWDMQNLTSKYFPLLAPRAPRSVVHSLSSPQGIIANDAIYYVAAGKLYKDGAATSLSGLTDGEKHMAVLGDYIVILPDKKYYRKSDYSSGSLAYSQTFSSVQVSDGTYKGEAAKLNTLKASSAWPAALKAGDAVKLTLPSGYMTATSATLIIREISDTEMRFYENSFLKTGTVSVTIAREVPDMDFICENENRLWGCKGDTIYASKLGDPFNWNVFDGIATDSFAVDVGSAGDFTAACAYLGYPVFFKEDHIYKVYGDRPSNFQVMSSASLGVENGSSKSLAIAGEILFYLSRAGVMAYSGGIPQIVSAPLGPDRYKNAVGGSDGLKYYVSLQAQDGTWPLFVYDTRYQIWHKEDTARVRGFAWNGDLYMMTESAILQSGDARTPVGVKEGAVTSFAEFGDFVESSPNAKQISKLQVRAEVDSGSSVQIKIMYDSDGVWHLSGYIGPTEKRSFYFVMTPRRVDHYRIRIEGTGNYRIHSLTRVYDGSSELRTKR